MSITFVDKWGCLHTYSLKAAADDLKALYNEWPGGLDEIESALQTARGQRIHIIPSTRTEPENRFWCVGCNPTICEGCVNNNLAT